MSLGTRLPLRLVCLVLLSLLGSSAFGQLASPDLEELRDRLLERAGEDYLETREDALNLPDAEFEELIQLLRKRPGATLDQIVHNALVMRRTDQVRTAEFDVQLDRSIANGLNSQSRSGRPVYSAWWPVDRRDLNPLAFEVIARRTVPKGLVFSFRERMSSRGPESIDPILYLASTSGVGHLTTLNGVVSELPENEQQRLIMPIVRLHEEARKQGSHPRAAIQLLSRMTVNAAEEALLALHAAERTRLMQEGRTPWSTPEPEIHQQFKDELQAQSDARAAVLTATREQHDPARIEALEAAYAGAEAHMLDVIQDRNAYRMWMLLDTAAVRITKPLD